MSDLKLFDISGMSVSPIPVKTLSYERVLQNVFEANLEILIGVRLLASEFKTSHGGRLDTLGIDENGCPVIIEYKRDKSQNVINQGLFYLDWLMDHKGSFEILVRDKLGRNTADKIDWSAPRLVCIARDFTKFDIHAINQMPRNIELIRFIMFGDGMLALELLTATTAQDASRDTSSTSKVGATQYKTVSEYLTDASPQLKSIYVETRDFMLGLGDDVQERVLKFYVAFKRIQNFACVEIRPSKGVVLMYLKVDPDSVELIPGFIRDVRKVGHYGTGDLEVQVRSYEDLERAKPLIEQAYGGEFI